jgi:HlyD family secretion protein
MNRRILAIVAVVIVLAVAGYFAWNWYSQNTAAQSTALTGSGTIETDEIAITPQTSGRIILAPAEEGIAVKTGDVLYRLDPAIAKLQIDQAKAGVRAARANYIHVRDTSGSSSADKAAAKAQWDQAKVALRMAQVQAGYTTIRSPINGTLSNIAALAGENAVPGGTLAIVSNPASLTVTIYIPETQIGQVTVGQKGTITTDSTTKTYHGQVVFIGTQAEFTPASIETKDQRVKLVYQVKLTVTDADSDLKPGMPADVTLQ